MSANHHPCAAEHPAMRAAYRELPSRKNHAVLVSDFDSALFVDANPAALALFGYSKSEFCRLTPAALSDLPREQHLKVSRELQDRGEAFVARVPLISKDAVELRADLYVRIYELDDRKYIVHVFYSACPDAEAVALRRAEPHAASIEALHRGLVTAVSDVVLLIDLADMSVVDANPAATNLLGYPLAEWRRLKLNELFPAESDAELQRAVDAVGEVGKARLDGIEGIARDQTRVRLDLKLNAYSALGRRLMVGVARDESELERHREELEHSNRTLMEAQAKLLHAQKLAAVGEVAAGVAHEINTPIAFLSMNLESLCHHLEQIKQLTHSLRSLVERSPSDDPLSALKTVLQAHPIDLESCEEILRDNRDGIERIRTVAQDLRVFSRVDAADVAQVDLNGVVQSAVNLVANEVRHRARLILKLGDVPLIDAERGKLGQVITNLIINAAHAIDEGDADHNQIQIVTQTVDDHIELTVTDSGCGMSSEVQSRIFDPFFTTKAREQGTGLGLSLCLEIVRRHGGALHVSSQLGKGTTLSMTLPIDNGLHRPATPARRAPPPREKRRVRILLIDDDVAILRAYRRFFTDHQTISTSSGAEAIALLEADRDFDLILCDLMMPDMDGRMVYEAIERIAPQMLPRLAFCTGGAFTSRARRWTETITNPIYEKPMSLETLERVLSEVAESR